ncbi:DedA family protein [Amaricoccus sp.]|uniref:DedA family protein n=1 Tax=Amaricoccus sp. TaxID=1872485 RepID=UPI002620C9E0|nr:DedA family protein [Amaricoccus sp.]HRO12628.1 DedA family protein [Amaricoccus sp.]
MEPLYGAIVDFLAAHQHWAPYLAFALALGETVAFVSIAIPSTAILVGVGGLIATGALHFVPIWIGAVLGALVGSTFSWWLGRRYGDRMLAVWPFSREPALVERGTLAFRRWGGGAIFVAHFFGPLRAVAFLVAGVSSMSLAGFQLANVPGVLIWAYAIPKAGEVGGNVIGHVWRGLFGA